MRKELICIADIQKASRVLRAVDHPLRRKILALLDKNEQLNVGELHNRLKIEQSVCSSHLGILRAEGIVKAKSLGKLRFYSIVPDRVIHINAYSQELARGHSTDKIFQQL